MEAQYWIPMVRRGSQYLDVYSSMLEDGIIFVNAPIDQRIAGLATSSLLHHAARGENTGCAKMYLNTKQGDIVSAMSIVDIIELYKRRNVEIQTLGFGEAGVAACLILASGTPRQRKVAAHCQLSLDLGLDHLDLPNPQERRNAIQAGRADQGAVSRRARALHRTVGRAHPRPYRQ